MPKRKRKESREKLGKQQAKAQHRGKFLSCVEPDVSSILKIPGTGQAEELELFDHPLHSTALSDFEEDDVKKDKCSEPDESTHKSSDSESEKDHRVRRGEKHGLKFKVERKDSEKEAVKENMRATDSTSSVEDLRLLSALPLRNCSSECRTSNRITDLVKTWNTDKMPRTSAKSPVRQNEGSSPVTENSNSDDDSPCLRKIWGPKGMKKVASHITQLDVILDEFEKITAKYKQGVESKICRKAIDNFYIGFRDQLTNTITDAEELKRTKLKNVKIVRATNKKRQRLIEIKEELIRTEPQLKKLQREYADLKGRLSSLRSAVQLVTDLEDLQQKYVNNKKKTPKDKIIYDISSVPALLVESRRILGVESDFQNIESKLQHMLDLQEEK